MKHRLWTTSVSALLLAASFLVGCAFPVGISPRTAAGSLTVQAGSLGSRTILPALGTVTYDLTMTGPDGAWFDELGDADGLFSLRNLALGDWTATVDVFSDTGSGPVKVASGMKTQTLTATSSPTLVVPVSWFFTGDTTNPVFFVDASASPYPVLAATAYWDGIKTGDTLNLADKKVSFNFGQQPQGIHQLRIVFYRDLQKTLPVGAFDQGIVYLATVGVPNIVLTAADFHPVGQPEMVEIAGGSFTFGTATATVSSFLIGKYPVTQAQFQAVMGFNPSEYNNSNTGARANPEATWSPVEKVSWFDAVEFSNRLSIAEGLQPVYTLTGINRSTNSITAATVTTDLSRTGYRLPTEVEYEYATRAGEYVEPYFWGGSDGANYSWGSYPNPAPVLTRTYGVGQKLPNAWGLYDMVGNAWGWLNDFSAPQPTVDTYDYPGADSGTHRLIRGGSFNSSGANLDSYFRSDFHGLPVLPGSNANTDVGFRVARRPHLEAGNPTAALGGSIPEATLDGGYGRFLHVAADLQHPGKFLVSGVSGVLNNTGISPWGTNLMARFNADASLDPTFGNNTDTALHLAQAPYGPSDMFSPFSQTNVIQTQYGFNGSTGESYFSGFAQNAYGLYVFQPSVAGGWPHTEVYRHDVNGILDVAYSQPVYTPGTQYFLPFVVYGQFHTLTPPVVDPTGAIYSAGYDAWTGKMAVTKMAADGAYPWQNNPINYNSRYFSSSFDIQDFIPVRTALQPDGQLLIVGNDITGNNGKLIRVTSNGTLDSGFGSAGTFSFSNGNANGNQRHYSAVRYWQGKIYLAGWDYLAITSPQVTGFIVRLNLDGSIDTTFAPGGNNGLLITPATPRYALPPPFTKPYDLDVGAFGASEVIAVVGATESSSQAFVALVTKDGIAKSTETLLPDAGAGSAALSVSIGDTLIGIAGYTNKVGGTQPYHTLPAFWRF